MTIHWTGNFFNAEVGQVLTEMTCAPLPDVKALSFQSCMNCLAPVEVCWYQLGGKQQPLRAPGISNHYTRSVNPQVNGSFLVQPHSSMCPFYLRKMDEFLGTCVNRSYPRLVTWDWRSHGI